MWKHHRTAIVIALVILAVVATVVWMKRPRPVEVDLATVELGDVERTVTNTRAGTLQACRRARLSPSIGGQIANLPVHEGDTVKQGQVLFEIWNVDLLAQVQLAKSEQISSQARAKEACVVAETSQREANRLVKLRKQGISSEEQADQAVGHARARQAACEASKAIAEVSKSKVDVAEAALARTRLTAPFDGTIAEVNGELGEFVTPSPIGIPTPPAIDLIDTTCLYVAAPIDEVDAPEIRAGMPGRISLDAFSKKFFRGKVRRVAPYVMDIEKQARTVDVEVDFLGGEEKKNMLPGYSADVEVIIDKHSKVLRIPSEALLEGNEVYVYSSSNDTVSRLAVKVGLSNWQYTEILEGLEQGQQVVTSIDAEGLEDGASVKASTSSKNQP